MLFHADFVSAFGDYLYSCQGTVERVNRECERIMQVYLPTVRIEKRKHFRWCKLSMHTHDLSTTLFCNNLTCLQSLLVKMTMIIVKCVTKMLNREKSQKISKS